MFSGDQRLHIVIVIPWIHHDDLIVIRDQKRHKTVCIRIFKDQQTFCRIICRRNINLRMISAEKHLILVFLFQRLFVISGRTLFLIIRITHEIFYIHSLRLKHFDRILRFMVSTL